VMDKTLSPMIFGLVDKGQPERPARCTSRAGSDASRRYDAIIIPGHGRGRTCRVGPARRWVVCDSQQHHWERAHVEGVRGVDWVNERGGTVKELLRRVQAGI
jgi:hypothetical protein